MTTRLNTSQSPALAFVVQAAVWNLLLFGVLRLAWVDQHLVGALVAFQKTLIYWYGTVPDPRLLVNSSCSGADVMALCAGVTLAYPVAWRRRVVGAAAGLTLVLALNAVRLASLHTVADDAALLDLLHVYVWPMALTLVTVAYVFLWIRWVERGATAVRRNWTRYGAAAAAGLVLYAFATPWAFTSAWLARVGAWTAATGASAITGLGGNARAAGTLLVTDRGAFQVTQECLFTPMLPLALAALAVAPMRRRTRLLGLALLVPVFFLLGVARVLVLALPPALSSSPVLLAHGFYQLLAGVLVIAGAAHLALRDQTGWRATARTLAALGLALGVGAVAGPVWNLLLVGTAGVVGGAVPAMATTLEVPGDAQGALMLLPAFQVALLSGLWMALGGGRDRRRLLQVFAVLFGTQLVLLVAVGGWQAWTGAMPHALALRTWALAVPIGLALVWAGAAGTWLGDAGYRRFWHDVGEEFPSLTGAASTRYYFDNEKRLIAGALPSLDGVALLKTDLWDEAKNTRIMQWAAEQGARVYGIDISEPIARQARQAFGRRPLTPVVSDVRRLPFGDGSFDAIYSMGTIEHFAETEATVGELARMLRPGGRLILGVPNRYDPFLRPLMVAVLYRLGLYGYGYEKSYSRRALRRMIEAAGLEVREETGILFIPGWLRMLDLWCFTRAPRLAIVTEALVRPFAWLDRRVSWLRRHGYLLATVAEKPYGNAPAAADRAGREARPMWVPAARAPVAEANVPTHTGVEFAVDARGCDPDALSSLSRLQALFAGIRADIGLHPLAPPVWHVFPGAGGVTGMVLLSESHLTIHTYPEAGFAAINLYCCRPDVTCDWEPRLRAALGARQIAVRRIPRG